MTDTLRAAETTRSAPDGNDDYGKFSTSDKVTFKCQKCSTAEYQRDGALLVLSGQSEKEVTQQIERWWKIGDILSNAKRRSMV